jgi:hypothetical protein
LEIRWNLIHREDYVEKRELFKYGLRHVRRWKRI